MKKRTRTVVIIATICIAVGLAFTGTAFALAGFNPKNLSTVGESEQKSYLAKFNDFDEVIFEGVSEDVVVEPTTDDTFSVDYYTGEYFDFEITEDNDVLKITEQRFFQIMVFNFNFEFDRKVVIKVPESFTGTLSIYSTSGTVTVEDFHGLKEVYAQSMSEDVRVANITDVGQINIYSTSGSVGSYDIETGDMHIVGTSTDINLGNIQASGEFQAETGSGDIIFNGITAETVNLYTVSGYVTGNTLAGTTAALNASSGWVEASSVDVAHISSETISGDITLSVNGNAEDYSITANTVSGEVTVPQGNVAGEKSIALSAGSGDINLAFA